MKTRKRTILLTLLALGLALVTGQAFAVADTFDGITFHPFTMDAGNTTCVAWDEDGDGVNDTRNCDPVNLVFPDQSAAQVVSALEARGWSTPIIGSDQVLHFDTPATMTQYAQLAKTVNSVRYHVRLWQVPDQPKTLGAVHGETSIFHSINTDWEAAEALLASELCGSDFDCETSERLPEQWAIQEQDPDNNDLTWREFANDGHLTVISTSIANTPPTAEIIAPAESSTVSGDATLIQIQATDAEDPAGTLTVRWRVGDGQWRTATYNMESSLYEATWDTTNLANEPHILYAKAVDSGGLSASDSKNINVDNESSASTIFVSLIVVEAVRLKGPQYAAVAEVHVVNDRNEPVPDAAVSGTFSGDSNGDDSSITGGDGVATLVSPSQKNGSSWIFCVNEIVTDGSEYSEPDNVETCDSTAGPISTGAVTGIVTDLDGVPIAGTAVTADTGQQTISDQAGSYTLAEVPEGERVITATAAGYLSQEKLAEVVAGAETTVIFWLASEGGGSGTLKGTVTDESSGKPIAGVRVSTDTGQSATTNKRGRFAIVGVPDGQRIVTASHPDYLAESLPTTIIADQTTTLDFILEPAVP